MNDPAPILDLIEAFRLSKTLFAAVKLGIFDGDRPDSPALDRLLDACTAMGLLEKRNGQYVNTPVSDLYLRSSSPRTLAGYIRYSNSVLYRLWGNLEDAVLQGRNCWSEAFGEGMTVSKAMSDPARKADFISGMHGFGQLSSPAVIDAFDLSRYRCFVDIGGATGHLAAAALKRYPQMKAILFDLPAVVEIGKDAVPQGITVVAGDFVSGELPEGDVFALGKILHSQGRAQSLDLLRKIHRRLPEGGAVLIVETLLQDDPPGPAHAHMKSLNMLVVNGGQERTVGEYADLLKTAGFSQLQYRITGTVLDAILAVKSHSEPRLGE